MLSVNIYAVEAKENVPDLGHFSRLQLLDDYERGRQKNDHLDLIDAAYTVEAAVLKWREEHPEWTRVESHTLPNFWQNRYGWDVIPGEVYQHYDPAKTRGNEFRYLFLTTGGGLYVEHYHCEFCFRRILLKSFEYINSHGVNCTQLSPAYREYMTGSTRHAWYLCPRCYQSLELFAKESA